MLTKEGLHREECNHNRKMVTPAMRMPNYSFYSCQYYEYLIVTEYPVI